MPDALIAAHPTLPHAIAAIALALVALGIAVWHALRPELMEDK